jgi:hypothetical protein
VGSRIATADGVSTGWRGGDHVLDTEFTLEKNVFPDHLAVEMWTQVDKLPAAKLRAYYQVELKALSKDNPSGIPSAKQKREAKELARDRLEEEAKDGRFRKDATFPVLWDRRRKEVLFAGSASQAERFEVLFEKTFGATLKWIDAAVQAEDESTIDVTPSAFVETGSPPDICWLTSESKQFLGNEFLLWLWWYADQQSDTLTLPDGSECTFMMARTLTLDCPRGQRGKEVFTHEGPTRLKEAKVAIQQGKLPRKAGFTLVHDDQQYEFVVEAEMFVFKGVKLPIIDHDPGVAARDRIIARYEQVGEFLGVFDAMYTAFLRVRQDAGKWDETLGMMQGWLKGG